MGSLEKRLSIATAMVVASCATTGSNPGNEKMAKVDGQTAALISASEFMQVSVSPDGQHIAALVTDDEARALTFFERASLEHVGSYRFPPEQTVLRYGWANDRRVVIEVGEYVGEHATPLSLGEIYAVDVDGSNPRMIFGYRAGAQQTGTKIKQAKGIRAWGSILDPLRDDPDEILVAAQPWDQNPNREVATRIYRVNVRSGLSSPAGGGPGVVDTFLTVAGRPRVAYRADSVAQGMYIHDAQKNEWVLASELLGLSVDVVPLSLSRDGATLFVVDTPNGEARCLYAVPLDGSARTCVVDAPTDPTLALTSPDGDALLAAEFEPDYPTWKVIDPEHPVTKFLQRLAGGFPDGHARPVSFSRDTRFSIVQVLSDRQPTRYYLADREEGSARILFAERDGIDPAKMGRTEAIRLAASDGLVLNGYITFPPGKAEKNLPLVVMPHGGPHGVRDHWAFAPRVQQFASKGYAVLRVNFRGSGGYGADFVRAGYREWGDRIITDIIEATRWTIAEGIADEDRIAILGGSFGAYAAAMAAAREPTLYRAVVGHSGLYDLRAMYDESDVGSRSYGLAYLDSAIGPDSAALLEKSPIGNASKITAPVLLIHGAEDERAPVGQARAFHDAIEAAKGDVTLNLIAGEAHGMARLESRLVADTTMLAFIEEHLAPSARR